MTEQTASAGQAEQGQEGQQIDLPAEIRAAIEEGELNRERGRRVNEESFETEHLLVKVRRASNERGWVSRKNIQQKAKLYVTGHVDKYYPEDLVEPKGDASDAEWTAYTKERNAIHRRFLAEFAAALGLGLPELHLRYSARDFAFISNALHGMEVWLRVKPNEEEAAWVAKQEEYRSRMSGLRNRRRALEQAAKQLGLLMDALDELDERDYDALEGASGGLDELLAQLEGTAAAREQEYQAEYEAHRRQEAL